MTDSYNPHTEPYIKESEFDKAIRPKNFEDFSGQDKVLDNLRVFVKAALLRGDVRSPLLVVAPIKVKGLRSICTLLAPGPLSIIMSMV